MSGEEKNKLDELFKSGLDKPDTHFEFHDQDWDDMEQLLDAHARPRRGIVYWLPVLSGVAAILLVFLGWWLFKPAAVTQQQQVAVKHLPKQQVPNNVNNSLNGNDSNRLNAGDHHINPAPNNVASVNKATQPDKTANTTIAPSYAGTSTIKNTYLSSQQAAVSKGTNQTTGIANSPVPFVAGTSKNEILAAVDHEKITPVANSNIIAELPASNMADAMAALTAKRTIQELANAEVVQAKKPTLTGYGKGPRLGLAMLVSPDINGAGSFQNAKVGTNIGLLFSVGITRRLTISTGAAYSKKPYMTDFSNYHTGYQFKTDPLDVYADCRVLDIPINLDYKLYSKSRNSFSVGSGLSSYIMLKEKYTYDYAVAGTVGPASFTVTNKNRHILGVLNLNVTYERQLNSKFSVAAQPYFKMPLTDIGNSQVRLQSAGVAVGVHWNINR